MKTFLLLLFICGLNCHSQTTYLSNLTTHANGVEEKIYREITISPDLIEIKSFGKFATHIQPWEVIEIEKLISDKSHEVLYRCISLDKEFPTIIMLLYDGDDIGPYQIIAIQPTPDNVNGEETIFWLEKESIEIRKIEGPFGLIKESL